MIRQIEEISLNGWPALQTIHYDGWIIRFADGVTKRSNSVNPIYESNLDVDLKIDYCEKLYRSQGLPSCFKITEIVQPQDLDQMLENRGYKRMFDISVQLINTGNFTTDLDKHIDILEFTDDSWLYHYVKMNGVNPLNRPVLKKIIDQIILPKGLFTLKKDGIIVGCGLGVIENHHIGLFDIVIDKQYRNQSLGQIMIENILRWGKSKGAETAYLQVLTDNASAIRLYDKVGFKEAYAYWYRIKP
jgi:hypothetical protein